MTLTEDKPLIVEMSGEELISLLTALGLRDEEIAETLKEMGELQ